MSDEQERSPDTLEAVKQLIDALGFIFAGEFPQLPPDRAAAVSAGIEKGTTDLCFTIDFRADRRLSLVCGVVEDNKASILFEFDGLTHNLGPAQLFLVKKNASDENKIS
jgi:hypothetical protein